MVLWGWSTNPREKGKGTPMGQVVPVGGNLAFSGFFPGSQVHSDYVNFTGDEMVAYGDKKETLFRKSTGNHWASMNQVNLIKLPFQTE